VATIKIYAKPSNLYRYRKLGPKLDQEVAALEQGFIFCPLLSEMNDPMEGTHRVSKRFGGGSRGDERQALVKDALESMGIASLSEVFDHEPMWAHYAEQFTGMCVQYNMNALLKGLGDDVGITRMIYSEQEPILLADLRTTEDRARHCLSSKTARWASEREWRIFQPARGEASYGAEKPIRKIFLGSRVTEADQKRIVAVGRQLGAAVVKMKVKAYSIEFGTLWLPKSSLPSRSAK
jgi:hypothetical protein